MPCNQFCTRMVSAADPQCAIEIYIYQLCVADHFYIALFSALEQLACDST